MPVRIPVAQPHKRNRWDGPSLALVALTAALAAASAGAMWALPRALLLPSLSVLMVALAAVVAFAAWRWREPQRPNRVTYWDIAGALTLFGIAAALLSDPAEVIPLLEARKAP